MELKIIEENENPLFGRKEIVASAATEIAPSRSEILGELAKRFSVPEENVKIKRILGNFGSKSFDVMANIYSSPEEKNSVEIKKKKEADAEKKAEAAKAEAPKEAAAEEKKAAPEEKSEENKPEEKKE